MVAVMWLQGYPFLNADDTLCIGPHIFGEGPILRYMQKLYCAIDFDLYALHI